MKIRTLVAGYILALALFLFAQRHPGSSSPTEFHSVVDLTYSIDTSGPSSESTRNAPHLKTVANIERNGTSFRQDFLPFETRIEAPARFAPGLWTVDQIPAERLVAPLVVLDVSTKSNDPDYQISVDDIAQWELTRGQIPLGAVVMAHTGWDARWTSSKDYRNADPHGTMHYPGYSDDAAKFLIQGRTTLGLGIDTLSVDRGDSKGFPVRQYALAHSVYQLENVANLASIPATGSMVVVAPAKMAHGSNGPVRILAMVR